MDAEKSKKFILRFFGLTAFLLILAAIPVIVVDPFFHYHGLLPGLKPVYSRYEYQVNGALEYLDYDAVMLGSSVTMNINSSAFDEAYGCTTEKAVSSGAHCCTLVYFLEKAFANRELKYVFWGLDPDQICYAIDPVPDQNQALFLRDKNPFNDVNYFWNIDVLFDDLPNMLAISRHADYDRGMAYDFTTFKTFGADIALETHLPEGEVSEMLPIDGEEYLKRINANMDSVEALVAAHPETEFKFFFTLAGILWWDIHYRDGKLERYYNAWENAVRRLDKYDNVTFYSGVFNDRDCIMDISHYCDYCHADYEFNQLQAMSVINEDRIITVDNMEEEIDVLKGIIKDFEDRLVEDGNWDFLYEYTKK